MQALCIGRNNTVIFDKIAYLKDLRVVLNVRRDVGINPEAVPGRVRLDLVGEPALPQDGEVDHLGGVEILGRVQEVVLRDVDAEDVAHLQDQLVHGEQVEGREVRHLGDVFVNSTPFRFDWKIRHNLFSNFSCLSVGVLDKEIVCF